MAELPYLETPASDPEQELKFVDTDIADACRKMNYVIGLPTQMQLARNIEILNRELNELLERTEEET